VPLPRQRWQDRPARLVLRAPLPRWGDSSCAWWFRTANLDVATADKSYAPLVSVAARWSLQPDRPYPLPHTPLEPRMDRPGPAVVPAHDTVYLKASRLVPTIGTAGGGD